MNEIIEIRDILSNKPELLERLPPLKRRFLEQIIGETTKLEEESNPGTSISPSSSTKKKMKKNERKNIETLSG